MSKKLKINLENCYGIKKLQYDFNFLDNKVFSIYAPNGTMKTSFSKTFQDHIKGADSKDIIFRDRVTVRDIKNERDDPVPVSQLLVIEPYNKSYKSEKISTLLVNNVLKEKYENILKGIELEKEVIFRKLRQLSGIGRANIVESEILASFGESDLSEFFLKMGDSINGKENKFSDIIYNQIFNEKVVKFLDTKDFKVQIKSYIERYNNLIESSQYFKKGFNHSNASTIQKNLKDNGFFKANHTVNLFNGASKKEVSSEEELQKILSDEMEAILSDADIQKQFNAIDSKLTTAELRDFREYLFENKKILTELVDLASFRKEIWISYFIECEDLLTNFVNAYKIGKSEIYQIIDQAKAELTDWQDVIDIFNGRFYVPFKLDVKNKEGVILKREEPNANFIFKDRHYDEQKTVNENDLFEVLSQGEKRALYILNIIFEVRARQKINQETILIIDDIADSFDYKNKYAIIEYLKEISEVPNFYLIILTHNFDFHRTISSRLSMGRHNRLNTIKNKNKILLVEERYQNDPLIFWKDNLGKDNTSAISIACIPFVRNISEYSGNQAVFDSLTLSISVENLPAISVQN